MCTGLEMLTAWCGANNALLRVQKPKLYGALKILDTTVKVYLNRRQCETQG